MVDEREDDPSIADEDGLLRRVPNWPNMVKFDHNLATYRPSSVCFSDRDTNDLEVSITLQRQLLESGGNEADAIKNHPGFGLACIVAGFVRNDLNHKQIVLSEPVDIDPFHGLVVGIKDSKTKSAMAKCAVLLINPDTI